MIRGKIYSIYRALCYDCALQIYLEIFLTHFWILNVVQNWLQKLIFENIINEEKHTKTKFKMNFSLGNMQLNTNSIFNGFNSFDPIRYKAIRSLNTLFALYFKSFNLKKESLKLSIGFGIGKNKLDLDRQFINISQDTSVY